MAMDLLIPLRDFPAERARRLKVRASGPRPQDLTAAADRIVHAVSTQSRTEIRRTIDYVATLEYAGSPLGAATYLAHVYRVTELTLAAVPQSSVSAAVIALLHNVMEVASVSREELAMHFGDPVAEAVCALTVDRPKQFDPAYKQVYYSRIASLGTVVSAVKACDKIDNLLTLCLNVDPSARARYIEEVRQFVVPLASTVSPLLERTVVALADDAERTGHVKGETSR